MVEPMPRRRLPILAFALALPLVGAAPASAAEKAKPGKDELQAVDLAAVGLPVVVQGKLVNYVFAYVRLITAPGADVAKARAKEPYFRDALIRAAHRKPFTDPKDLNHVDEGALKAALLPDVRRIAGPGVITAVVVVSQQPQHRLARVAPTAAPSRAPIP